MKITPQQLATIKTDLTPLAGRLKLTVKLDKTMDVGCRFKQYDAGYEIKFNPNRIHTGHVLNRHLNFCRGALTQDM